MKLRIVCLLGAMTLLHCSAQPTHRSANSATTIPKSDVSRYRFSPDVDKATALETLATYERLHHNKVAISTECQVLGPNNCGEISAECMGQEAENCQWREHCETRTIFRKSGKYGIGGSARCMVRDATWHAWKTDQSRIECLAKSGTVFEVRRLRKSRLFGECSLK